MMTEALKQDNRRRVALVSTELGVGGAEQCLVQLATRLPGESYRILVVSLAPPPAAPRDGLVRRLADAGIETRFIGASRKRQFWAAIRALTGWFVEERIELVQSFLFHANIISAQAATRARVRRFVTGWRVADPRPWRPRLERFLTRNADRVVCVSQRVARQARTVGIPLDKLVVIPNGVDIDRFVMRPKDMTAVEPPAGRKWFVSVGRLDSQKGFDWLLQRMPEILERLPDHDWCIVGDGAQRTELQTLIQQLDVSSRVRLVGWQADVPGWLSAASVVLIPSRWEGMPNVLLEAMASGRPVVATRVEGVAEVLGPLADEQSVEPGDDDRFVERTIALATAESSAAVSVAAAETLGSLGVLNRKRVASHYSVTSMINAYDKLYGQLLRNGLHEDEFNEQGG